MSERRIACIEDEECKSERCCESIDADFRPVSGRLTGRMRKFYILLYICAKNSTLQHGQMQGIRIH